MVEEIWERKYIERCNICGESIETIIKRKVKEAQKELLEDIWTRGFMNDTGYQIIKKEINED